MVIGFLKENDKFETRSMLLPEHVNNISKIGFKVFVEKNYAEKLNVFLPHINGSKNLLLLVFI